MSLLGTDTGFQRHRVKLHLPIARLFAETEVEIYCYR